MHFLYDPSWSNDKIHTNTRDNCKNLKVSLYPALTGFTHPILEDY